MIRHWRLLITFTCWTLIPISSPVLADFDTALTAFKKGNSTEAFKQLHPLEKQGDPQSQSLLGIMYLEGEGVKQNYKTAAQWFQKSAEQGDELAEYNIGLLYERGKEYPAIFPKLPIGTVGRLKVVTRMHNSVWPSFM